MIEYDILAKWLPRLNPLTQMADSRQWAAVLQGVSFGFSVDKAATLLRAMILDIYGPLVEKPADLAAKKVCLHLIWLAARLTVLPRQEQTNNQIYYSIVHSSCH